MTTIKIGNREITVGSRIDFMCGSECDVRVNRAKVVAIDENGIHVEWFEGCNLTKDTISKEQVCE